MRVLFTAAPEVGHIVPLLGVAGAARDAGHEVLFATHPSRHPLLVDAGLDVVAAGWSSDEVIAERLRRWPETASRSASDWGVRMWVHIAAPPFAADIAALAEEWRPDIVVHEEGEYGAPPVAAALGVPWVTHAWGAPLRSTAELATVSVELEAAGLWDAWGLSPPRFGGLSMRGLINPCPPFLDPTRRANPVEWPVRASILGTNAVDREPSRTGTVCYIGFGTVPVFANATHHITAAAKAAVSAGLEVVATVSDQPLAQQLTRLGADVRPFINLPDLLPDCAVVITHGGVGTTLAALAHGIPVIAAPQGAPSQQRMANAVERARLGSCARSPLDLQPALSAVLSDQHLAERAANAALTMRTQPSPESIVPLLERVAAQTPNHTRGHPPRQ